MSAVVPAPVTVIVRRSIDSRDLAGVDLLRPDALLCYGRLTLGRVSKSADARALSHAVAYRRTVFCRVSAQVRTLLRLDDQLTVEMLVPYALADLHAALGRHAQERGSRPDSVPSFRWDPPLPN